MLTPFLSLILTLTATLIISKVALRNAQDAQDQADLARELSFSIHSSTQLAGAALP